MTIDPTRFMNGIFSMWTEHRPEVRRAAIAAHFHDDVRFFDHDGTMTGHAALEAFSDSLQRRFPEARFTLASPPQVLGDALRAYWTLGPLPNGKVADGMDFVILDGDKVRTLYAFVHVPSPAATP